MQCCQNQKIVMTQNYTKTRKTGKIHASVEWLWNCRVELSMCNSYLLHISVRILLVIRGSPGLWACPKFLSASCVVLHPQRKQSNPHQALEPLRKRNRENTLTAHDLTIYNLHFPCGKECLEDDVTETLSSDVLIVDRSNRPLHSFLFLSFPFLPLQLSTHVLRQ